MKAILVDENRDPILKNGKFQFVYDIDVVAQNCDQAMRQQLGELNYDQLRGVDYLNNVYSGAPNFQRFEAQARTVILSVEGVTGINSFKYELVSGNITNALEYAVEIATIYGVTTVDDSFSEAVSTIVTNQITLALVAAQRYINAGANYANQFQI